MIDDLIRATDSVTEIQNTVPAGCPVRLTLGECFIGWLGTTAGMSPVPDNPLIVPDHDIERDSDTSGPRIRCPLGRA